MKSLFVEKRYVGRWSVALCLLFLVISGCRSGLRDTQDITDPGASSTPQWPTNGWCVAEPQAMGVDEDGLSQMLDDVRRQDLNLHSLLVVRNGCLVSETYFDGYTESRRQHVFSVTKSVVATLVGIAIDQGLIERKGFRTGVNIPLLAFFPGLEVDNLDARKEAMTLENVLTMSSGLSWLEGNQAYESLYISEDWEKYMLDLPMSEQPGGEFNYCSGCSHLLTAVVQSQTGMNTREFADRNLFQPLGIHNYEWDLDNSEIPIGGWGLHLTPRDMAKLGYLYLRQGVWEDRQVVSQGWVEQATQKHIETGDGELGYGYQWWVIPTAGAYTALGRGGQMIYVVPEQDLIMVTTAENESHDVLFQLIEQHLLPAVQ